MTEHRRRRAVELAKDAAIVLLACTALWLAAQVRLLEPLGGLFREEGPQGASGPEQSLEEVTAISPLVMAVQRPGLQGPGLHQDRQSVERYGVQHDRAACRELFQQVAGPLAEALSSAGAPQSVAREQWEQVLGSGLGAYMDFGGQIPLEVLTGWLAGGGGRLDATVRKLVLTVQEEGVDLYYRNEEDGQTYRCRSQVADPGVLGQILASLSGNGAFFAFEDQDYQDLDPDTLLFPDVTMPMVYTVSDPVDQGRSSLEEIVRDLGIPLGSTSFYSADEQVARNGEDSVRLSPQGVALYTAGEGGGRFSLSGPDGRSLLDLVEACRQLALATIGSRSGEARVYLSAVRTVPGGWEIDFDYALNGIPVVLDEGYAARFRVQGDRLVQFTLCFRSYAAAGTAAPVLPPLQAAAALKAKGLEGRELLLIYPDNGGDTIAATWAARDETGEG